MFTSPKLVQLTRKPITIIHMKTIKVLVALLFITTIFGCNEDDDVVNDQNNQLFTGEDRLELQFQSYAVDLQIRSLLERREEILVGLEQDPDNQSLLAELEDVEGGLISATELNNQISNNIVGFGLGPVPPPPPCLDPGPLDNCILFIGDLRRLSLGINVDNFQFIFSDLQTQEELFSASAPSPSNISQNLEEYAIPIDGLTLPEVFLVSVSKQTGGLVETYSFRATVNQ